MTVRRRTHMLTARLHRPTLDAIDAAAERLGEARGLTVEAMVAVALRHEDEVRAEAERIRGVPEKSTGPTCVVASHSI